MRLLTSSALMLLLTLRGSLAAEVFRAEKLAAMNAAIRVAIASNQCPGGVLWLEHNGRVYHKAYGHRALTPKVEEMTEDTIFDAASLTKVVATTPAIMILLEAGKIQLDAPVREYIPEFSGGKRDQLTVRELLTHTSGLPEYIETKSDWHRLGEAIRKTCAEPLKDPPGTKFRYSDINFIILGEIVHRMGRLPLEVFVKTSIPAITYAGYRLLAAIREVAAGGTD